MLGRDLSGPDMPWKVAEQADFAVGGATLLEKLDRYICDSAAVFHLIGDALGAVPSPLEVETFLKKHPAFLSSNPNLRQRLGNCRALSYTQWEAYMALDRSVLLYVYYPSADFDEREPGFSVSDVERAAQAEHRNRILALGLDRAEFSTAERLSSLVLRSCAGIISRTGDAADGVFAESLIGSAKIRESSGGEVEGHDAKAEIVPFNIELMLPSLLVVGQSGGVQFRLREPGRTPLEEVDVELELGSARITAHRDLMTRGEDLRLIADSQLIPQEVGTPQIRLAVTCSRLSSLRERFEWKSFLEVLSDEAAATVSGTARNRFHAIQVNLELKSEILSPRQGVHRIELRPVPAAGRRFEMGSSKAERGHEPDEELHPVRFRRSWWMSRHPVSQEQFLAVMGRNPSKFSAQSTALPVESVTWYEAREFCERLTHLERAEENLPLGFNYRLPTEAEWEFSCRGDQPATSVVSSSRPSTEVGATFHPISTFPLDGNRGANQFGLCDMTGNVFQWCLDDYGPYPQGIEPDPCLSGSGSTKVIRGGSWHDPLSFRRATARAKCDGGTRSSRIGFRIVLARL